MERCNNERARLNQIPVLYVRGDNFTVGYTIVSRLKHVHNLLRQRAGTISYN